MNDLTGMIALTEFYNRRGNVLLFRYPSRSLDLRKGGR